MQVCTSETIPVGQHFRYPSVCRCSFMIQILNATLHLFIYLFTVYLIKLSLNDMKVSPLKTKRVSDNDLERTA